LAVIVIAWSVLPWKAWSNTTTPGRPVKYRAIFTAFSTASAPELANMVFRGSVPGASWFRRSASATYGSLIVTWKQVWVNRSACSRTASTTAGAALPVFRTARPAPRSIRLLPSTSWMMAPAAASTKMGVV
jgi:hypothetical protein